MDKTHHHYTLHDATEEDAEQMTRMHAQSWLDTYPDEAADVPYDWIKDRVGLWMTSEGIEKRRERIREATRNPAILLRVAKDASGVIIGLVRSHGDEKTQYIGALYVDKDYHGSGVAQQLMDEVIAWVDPLRPLELEVVAYNERAKAFYRKYGFKEVKDSEHILHERIPVVTMIRKGDKQ